MAVKKKIKRAEIRSKAAEIAASINSSLGSPALKLASDPDLAVVKVPTNSLTMNRVTGGGFVLGRHVELFGDPSSGKSSIAYGTMALSQARGNLCGLIDPEGVFDPQWYEHLGGFADELLYHRPKDAEDAISTLRLLTERAIEGDPIEIVTIDSIAALVTKEQMEKDPREEERVASQARMMSRALRVLTTRNKRVLFLWINQEREKPGVMFGSNRTQPGGRAMSFYATTRIEMRRTGQVTEERPRSDKGKLQKKQVKVGDWIQVKAEKEKSARPFMQGAYIYNADEGEIDLASEIIQLGMEDGIIDHVGNNYIYSSLEDGDFKGTLKQWRKILKENADLKDEIVSIITDQTHELAKVEVHG